MRYRRLDKQPVSFSPLAHPRDADFHMNHTEAGDGRAKGLSLSLSLSVSLALSLPFSLCLSNSLTHKPAFRETSLAVYEVASHSLFVCTLIQTNKSQNSALSVLCRTSLLEKKNEKKKTAQQINFLQRADTAPVVCLLP